MTDTSLDAAGRATITGSQMLVPPAPLETLEPMLGPIAGPSNTSNGAGVPDHIGEDESEAAAAGSDDVQSTPDAAKSTKNRPIIDWIPHRLGFVRAFLKLDGRPRDVVRGTVKGCSLPGCPRAATPMAGIYRCVSSNCMTCTWLCAECMVERHKYRPLDRIEIWMNGEWQKSSLQKLGVKVQFGHWDGTECRLLREPAKSFVVIHTNGVHEIDVEFCGCTTKMVHKCDQLMAARWYPATTNKPRMAATFEVLEQFDANCGAGKQNAYDFYRALEHLTDGAGLQHLPDRSKDFFRMAHEYRHVLALKRGGRGHDATPDPIKTTEYGELAVLCPACPHQGINTNVVDKLRSLSPRLAEAAPLFNELVQLSMDCNFRAKNRMTRSTPESSPYLGDGMAYMVPESPYEDYTRSCLNDQELSSCSRFGANILANLKTGKGLRTTGVGAVFCSRHEFFWPNSVGTLVKGERYSTMDFILAAAVRRVRAPSLHLYYDIVCQYHRNLNVRMMEAQPKSFIGVGAKKLLHQINVSFGIPKFHNPGHLVMCQLWFNIAYIRAAGQTDGEASERAWAGLNPAASSLREMGPGTMRDTIDFFCGVWNWRKFVNMGGFLTRKLEVALREAREHAEIYTGMERMIRKEDGETAIAWVEGAVKWDTRNALNAMGQQITEGPDAVPNPYESRAKKQSLDKARLQSAQLAAQAVKDTDGNAAQASALTNFVMRGFKIEVLQWRAGRRKATKTILQTTERIEHHTALRRELGLFRKDQQWMMPLVYAAIQELEGVEARTTAPSEGDDEDELKAEENESLSAVLYLPSELDKALARTPPVLDVLFKELELRLAGMEDWLDSLRQQLRVRGTVTQWRISYSGGQRMATRTINKQRVIEENIVSAREMYKLHRERFITLLSYLTDEEREARVPPDWADNFRELLDTDCRPLNSSLLLAIDALEVERAKRKVAARNDGVASGASSYRIPWIWYKVGESTEMELNEDMRVEFVKCRARAIRWVEEVYKIAYEMVRVPEFCTTRSLWWTKRATVVIEGADLELQDGMRAYATKQATMFRRHAAGLEDAFKKPLEEVADFVRVFGLDGLISESSE
ncbi:unnamed protein product [Peniophora sp. CBMAI 1063]|nr:unnamed protein product [Peniophora sp. CBMAI 1063]